jgi:CRP-like cAMP-binding protein
MLAENEILTLLEISEIIEFSEDEIIVAEDDYSPSLFLIIGGEVSVSVTTDNKSIHISDIGPGDFFGEAAIFVNVKRSANIRTAGPSVVLKLVRDDFNHLITHYPKIGNKLMLLIIYGLLKKLRNTNADLAFERKMDLTREDVDSLINDFFS